VSNCIEVLSQSTE